MKKLVHPGKSVYFLIFTTLIIVSGSRHAFSPRICNVPVGSFLLNIGFVPNETDNNIIKTTELIHPISPSVCQNT
jgi:hypothetical protein